MTDQTAAERARQRYLDRLLEAEARRLEAEARRIAAEMREAARKTRETLLGG